MSNDDNAVLDVRVSNLERVVDRVSVAVESIDESLKTLTRLDVKHEETNKAVDRAFADISDHETRIRVVETEMPTMKLIRGWVIAGVVSLVGLVGLAIAAMVIK